MTTGSRMRHRATGPPLFWRCAFTIIGLVCLCLCFTWVWLAGIHWDTHSSYGLIFAAFVVGAWGAAFLTCPKFALLGHVAMVATGIGIVWMGVRMVDVGNEVFGWVVIILGMTVVVGYLRAVTGRSEEQLENGGE